MQAWPKLRTEAPTARWSRSMTVTLKPAFRASAAWARPMMPAPTTRTSVLATGSAVASEFVLIMFTALMFAARGTRDQARTALVQTSSPTVHLVDNYFMTCSFAVHSGPRIVAESTCMLKYVPSISDEPIHQQLSELFREKISSGDWKEGRPLP